MEHPSRGEVTRLLEALQQDAPGALDALLPLVYGELRALAHRHRARWHGDYTLNTTALVHEAYLKLVDQERATWENRAHFLATAARAMRHILVNYARDRRAQKRGGDRPKLSIEGMSERLDREVRLTDENADLLLALDEALRRLERQNERQSRIVECRFFGGLTIEETAAALGLSTATVNRGWALAQVRLYQEMKRESTG